jgi:HD domain-containing protein
MRDIEPVGLVVGTVAATPLQFSVAISPEQYLQLDDVVVTSRELPGLKPVQVSGVVTNVEAVHEGARFASDVFLIEQGALPAEVAEIAQVSVTRVEPEVYVPPMPVAPVYRATGRQRDQALYFDEMGDQKVPVGFGCDGNPVYLNFEFVDGTRGAHISISGVSGIATKTSFALFLLHSILNTGVLQAEAHNTKMLVFSVKGEDLLFLDYANSRLNQEDRDKYSRLGLPAVPFQNVRVFAPPRKGDASGTPDVTARTRPSVRSTGRSPNSARTSCSPSSSPTPRTNAPSTRCSSARSPPASKETPSPPATTAPSGSPTSTQATTRSSEPSATSSTSSRPSSPTTRPETPGSPAPRLSPLMRGVLMGRQAVSRKPVAMSLGPLTWAYSIAEQELACALPRRWAHSQGVAGRARELGHAAGRDADTLESAAVLHDVGYAPRLACTGFHPLDGARFLRDVHPADERLVRMVANHSFALLEAEERGLRTELEHEFPLLGDQFLVDALVWCDMTTTPNGEPTTATERVAEIASRYCPGSPVGRFIRRATPEILAAVARVDSSLQDQLKGG